MQNNKKSMQKIKFPCNQSKYEVMQFFGEPASATTKKWYLELGFKNGWHNGVDFGCPTNIEVVASIDGICTTKTTSDGNNMLWIYGKGLAVMYCHLNTFRVKTGDNVKAGYVVALSGNTGKYTTGAHLHFGLYELEPSGQIKNLDNGLGGAIDPAPYLALTFEDDTFVKPKNSPEVCIIKNQRKWWLVDERSFENYTGKKVEQVSIKETDLITYNSYKMGTIRFI